MNVGRQPAVRALVPASVVLFACALALAGLQRHGVGGRVHGAGHRIGDPELPVRAVRTAGEVWASLVRAGGRGRVVVSISRYLHFQAVDDDAFWRRATALPIELGGLDAYHAERVTDATRLWVAVRTGVAREVVHILPWPTWREKRAAALVDATDVRAVSDGEIVAHLWGSRRTLTASVPSSTEPVLLEIDASYFELSDPVQLLQDLVRAGLEADLLILNSAEDNPAVTERGRAGLERFARELPGARRGH